MGVAQAFHETLAIDGVIMSKLDGDARGGAALSVKEVIGRPIAFASTGEKLNEFEQFHPDRMASRILGMGDMLTLIDKAEQAWEKDKAEEAAERLLEGEFTLDDFLEQMQQLKKMGPLGGLLGLMPGMPKELKGAKIEDDQLKPIEAIIRSMTPLERRKPEVMNGSRRTRVANGSGTTVSDVNKLIKQFAEMQKMMKRMGVSLGGGGKGKKGKKGKGGEQASCRSARRLRRPGRSRSGEPARSVARGHARWFPGRPPLTFRGSFVEGAPFNMAVKLRLTRVGKTKQPQYRIVASDSRSPRDGRFIQIIGTYNPRTEPSTLLVDNEKAVKWLRDGAQPTERVKKLLEISGAWADFDAATARRSDLVTDELVDTANQIPAPVATAVLTHVVRSLVDDPDSVRVHPVEGRHRLKLEVTVGPGDLGRVIGRRGRTAQSIRTVVRAAATRDGVEIDVDFVD